MLAIVEQIKVGRVDEFDSFMSAVIDQKVRVVSRILPLN